MVQQLKQFQNKNVLVHCDMICKITCCSVYELLQFWYSHCNSSRN